MAAMACCSSIICANPNPRDRPVSLSVMTLTSEGSPYGCNSILSSSAL